MAAEDSGDAIRSAERPPREEVSGFRKRRSKPRQGGGGVAWCRSARRNKTKQEVGVHRLDGRDCYIIGVVSHEVIRQGIELEYSALRGPPTFMYLMSRSKMMQGGLHGWLGGLRQDKVDEHHLLSICGCGVIGCRWVFCIREKKKERKKEGLNKPGFDP